MVSNSGQQRRDGIFPIPDNATACAPPPVMQAFFELAAQGAIVKILRSFRSNRKEPGSGAQSFIFESIIYLIVAIHIHVREGGCLFTGQTGEGDIACLQTTPATVTTTLSTSVVNVFAVSVFCPLIVILSLL